VCFKSVNSRFGGALRKSGIDTATEDATEMTRNAPPSAEARGKGVAGSEHGEKVVSNLKRWSMFGLKRALSAEIGAALHALWGEFHALLVGTLGQISKCCDNANRLLMRFTLSEPPYYSRMLPSED
jgi:hypothetical protein